MYFDLFSLKKKDEIPFTEKCFVFISHSTWLIGGNSVCEFPFNSQSCCKFSLGFGERLTYKSHLIKKFPHEMLAGDQSVQDLIKLLCIQYASSLSGSVCCQSASWKEGDKPPQIFSCHPKSQGRKTVCHPTRIQVGWATTMKGSAQCTVALLTGVFWTCEQRGPWILRVLLWLKKWNSFEVWFLFLL